MDMKKFTYLPGWTGPVLNAATWLREQKSIPSYQSIEDEFKDYFRCDIYTEYPKDGPVHRTYAVFEEKDAILFILKWS